MKKRSRSELKMASKGYNKELLFKALADRTRLRLLNLMGDDEVCVCFFVEVLRTPQPKISRHLAYLRRAGVVTARREGKWIHYRIVEPDDPRAVRVMKEVRAWLNEDSEMKNDRARLIKVCCSSQPPILIEGAPRPASIVANI
jgi:ArsR family transcriptional regulator, arsenate/arsenite/antimonite-responsive transcriptional repressor